MRVVLDEETQRGSMSLKAFGYQSAFRLLKVFGSLRKVTPERMKKQMEDGIGLLGKPPKDVEMEDVEFDGIPGVRFTPPDARKDVELFFVHGGGYISCSARLYGVLISKLAKALRMVVHAPDYRHAPEHKLPAALDDCLKAYRSVSTRNLVLGGDSAGGGLVLSMLQSMRDDNERLPTCAFTVSALADLTCSGESMENRRRMDPMMTPAQVRGLSDAACGEIPPEDVRVSPVLGDFNSFPPILFMVGEREVLFSDSLRCHEKALASGVDSEFYVGKKMHHDWIMFPIKEAKPGIQKIVDFVESRVASAIH